MGKPSALHGRLVPQVEASGDTSRSGRVDLPAKSGEPIEHGVEQRPKARAAVKAGENCARLLLENSKTYFVCSSFEKRVHTFFGCLHVKLESENVLTHGKRLLLGNFAAGEQRCFARQVECLAMPVKWSKGLG